MVARVHQIKCLAFTVSPYPTAGTKWTCPCRCRPDSGKRARQAGGTGLGIRARDPLGP